LGVNPISKETSSLSILNAVAAAVQNNESSKIIIPSWLSPRPNSSSAVIPWLS
jgi:hypothetical protein